MPAVQIWVLCSRATVAPRRRSFTLRRGTPPWTDRNVKRRDQLLRGNRRSLASSGPDLHCGYPRVTTSSRFDRLIGHATSTKGSAVYKQAIAGGPQLEHDAISGQHAAAMIGLTGGDAWRTRHAGRLRLRSEVRSTCRESVRRACATRATSAAQGDSLLIPEASARAWASARSHRSGWGQRKEGI
jgi:hypothetical protein